jgi:hypothetical protein
MIAKQLLRAVHEVGLTAGISIICVATVNGQSIRPPIGTPLPDPPQVVTSFELQAINDPATGKGAFVFEGHEVPSRGTGGAWWSDSVGIRQPDVQEFF